MNETFEITVFSTTRTNHAVTLEKSYYNELTSGSISQEELILRSFNFLLQREQNSSILPEFNLRVIGTYFPEYEKTMRQQCANSHTSP